jgi:hypothetical protein
VRALAYTVGRGYATELAEAFAKGCQRHGVACEVRSSAGFRLPEPCDVIWLYGVTANARVFADYLGRRRVTGDLGYWREDAARLPMERRPVRIAVDSQQPDAHLRLRAHPPDRFLALGLEVEPVQARGARILLAGQSEEQARFFGFDYGEWEALTVARLSCVSARPVVARAKPNSPPLRIPGTLPCRDAHAADAVRKAWAVVTRSGNIGADAILHGVPCFAEAGPGACYSSEPLEAIDGAQPLKPELRRAALADLAYWQWTQEEFASGALWEHLRREGMLG